jgi:hypothetical protein
MSSITAADLKLGGRVVTACDAIGAGHLRRAAGIFAEIADDLNTEAEASTGLLSEDHSEVQAAVAELNAMVDPNPAAPPQAEPADLQMCARNVHSYGPADKVTGWRTCSTCGNVNVAPPDGGPVDMSERPLGDYA